MIRKVKLSRTERIVAVTPEMAAGPGWANSPTWVHIVDHATNAYRQECIQPEERTPELNTLYACGAIMHSALMRAVPTIKRAKP